MANKDNDKKDEPTLRIRVYQRAGKAHCDELIISAMVLGSSLRDAAKHAGVSVDTVHRRLENPRFLKKLQDARREILRESVDRAASYGKIALTKLLELTDSTHPAVALGAAKTLVEVAFRMREFGSFEERLRALEEMREDKEEATRLPA